MSTPSNGVSGVTRDGAPEGVPHDYTVIKRANSVCSSKSEVGPVGPGGGAGVPPRETACVVVGEATPQSTPDAGGTEGDALRRYATGPSGRPYGLAIPPPAAVRVQRARLGTGWSRWVDRVKRSVLTCFGCHDVVDEWVQDDALRQAIRDEMLLSGAARPLDAGDSPPLEHGAALAIEVGMSNASEGGGSVCHVPRLVAAAVVALRVKLGVGAMRRDGPEGPGNVAVVRREAAKMMRDWNVRHMDAAAHLHLIERAFFEDDTHFRVSTWRARACRESKFVRWVVGKGGTPSFDC